MAKAKKMMIENLKLVDLVIEIIDARIPISSRNPDIDKLAVHKKRIVVLNKSDLAEKRVTDQWKAYFLEKNLPIILTEAHQKKGVMDIFPLGTKIMQEKIESQKKRGRKMVPIRAMVVGIPNVGKSTIINQIAGRNVAKTADKPGVTRGKQWVRLKKDFELLDTPGLLWPKQSDKEVAKRLAFVGTFNQDVINQVELARELLNFLYIHYKDDLLARYKIEDTEGDLLLRIGAKRGFLLQGGLVDDLRASIIVLDEFRGGKIGRISLEKPTGKH